jgi:hypothetical protein
MSSKPDPSGSPREIGEAPSSPVALIKRRHRLAPTAGLRRPPRRKQSIVKSLKTLKCAIHPTWGVGMDDLSFLVTHPVRTCIFVCLESELGLLIQKRKNIAHAVSFLWCSFLAILGTRTRGRASDLSLGELRRFLRPWVVLCRICPIQCAARVNFPVWPEACHRFCGVAFWPFWAHGRAVVRPRQEDIYRR